MAWIKVPAENPPLFYAALPKDPRVETLKMFGGVAAKVNGHFFAGLFQRSTVLYLAGADRETAMALEGAGLFDPMGDGRRMSDKVMLPELMMDEPDELRRWIALAFKTAVALPPKAKTPKQNTKVVAKVSPKARPKQNTKAVAKVSSRARPKKRR